VKRVVRSIPILAVALASAGFAVVAGEPAANGAAPTVPVGSAPVGVSLDAAANTLYVADSGSNTVSVINAATCNAATLAGCSPVASPTVGTGPYGVAVDALTDTVYVTNQDAGTVSVIDGTTCNSSIQTGCTPVATITVGGDPYGLAVDPTTDTVYVANLGSDDVAVINGGNCDATSQSGCVVAATAQVGPQPIGVAVDPATATVYVVDNGDPGVDNGGVAVLDETTCDAESQSSCTPIATASVGSYPYGVFADDATQTVYVTNLGGYTVSVLDEDTCDAASQTNCAPVATANVGLGPYNVVVDDASQTAYVTSYIENEVSVFDTATCDSTNSSNCTAADVPTADGPFGIAVDPASSSSPNTVFAADYGSAALSVFGEPAAPTQVVATGDGSVVNVSWSAPVDEGQIGVASYTINPSPGCPTCTGTTVSGTVTSTSVGGLTPGTPYTFTVTASNAAGAGPVSAPSGSAVPIAVPDPPSPVTATLGAVNAPGDGMVILRWTAPFDNGSPLTGYSVTPTPACTACSGLDPAGTATSTTVSGLEAGVSYTFAVAATNSVGTGPAGTSSAITPVTVTPAPTAVHAGAGPVTTPGDGEVDLSWTAPVDEGSPITVYTVTPNPACAHCTGLTPTAASTVVTGLTPGKSYSFTVVAHNGAGKGATSATSDHVTPYTVPGPPGKPTAHVTTSSKVALTWSPPKISGGEAITHYLISAEPACPHCTGMSTTATSTTVVGLKSGIKYTFTVRAGDRNGTGPSSPPSAPATVLGIPSERQLRRDGPQSVGKGGGHTGESGTPGATSQRLSLKTEDLSSASMVSALVAAAKRGVEARSP
jgi:YVTN family beta-propeller protein